MLGGSRVNVKHSNSYTALVRSPPATLRTVKQAPTTRSCEGPRAMEPAATAIPQLVELHGPRLYSLASRLCGNVSDAEDMVQEVFLQAHRKWHTFKGDANPGTSAPAPTAQAPSKGAQVRRSAASGGSGCSSGDSLAVQAAPEPRTHARPTSRRPALTGKQECPRTPSDKSDEFSDAAARPRIAAGGPSRKANSREACG